MRAFAACLVVMLSFVAAHADSCGAGTFDRMQGTTCSIGGLQFAFQTLGGYGSATYDLSSGNQISSSTYPLSDIKFNPFSDETGTGFRLANVPTATSTTGTSTSYSMDFYYTVSALDGTSLTGSYIVRLGGVTSANDTSVIGKNTVSETNFPYTFLGAGHDWELNGTESQSDVTLTEASSPFVESEWKVGASNGTTASVDTVTYAFVPTVPEPSAALLLFSGFVVLLRGRRSKVVSSDIRTKTERF